MILQLLDETFCEFEQWARQHLTGDELKLQDKIMAREALKASTHGPIPASANKPGDSEPKQDDSKKSDLSTGPAPQSSPAEST